MQLNALLEVYKKRLRAPQKTVVASFCSAVEQVLSIKLDPRAVGYTPTSRTLTISAPGVFKQEIKIREQELLAIVAKDIGEKNKPQKIL